MLLAMAGELSVLRDRHDTLERIIENKRIDHPQEIEAYEPDKDAIAERDAKREEYLDSLGTLRFTGMGKNDLSNWQAVIDRVSEEANFLMHM